MGCRQRVREAGVGCAHRGPRPTPRVCSDGPTVSPSASAERCTWPVTKPVSGPLQPPRPLPEKIWSHVVEASRMSGPSLHLPSPPFSRDPQPGPRQHGSDWRPHASLSRPPIGLGNQSPVPSFGASPGQPSWNPQTGLAARPHLRSLSHWHQRLLPGPSGPQPKGTGRTARASHASAAAPEPKEHVNRPLEKTVVAAQEYILRTLSPRGGT